MDSMGKYLVTFLQVFFFKIFLLGVNLPVFFGCYPTAVEFGKTSGRWRLPKPCMSGCLIHGSKSPEIVEEILFGSA